MNKSDDDLVENLRTEGFHTEADRFERLSKDNQRLAEIIRDLDGLIEHAQQILGNHLPPDGMSKDDAINMLLELLDGPDQREIQSRARTALQLHKGE